MTYSVTSPLLLVPVRRPDKNVNFMDTLTEALTNVSVYSSLERILKASKKREDAKNTIKDKVDEYKSLSEKESSDRFQDVLEKYGSDLKDIVESELEEEGEDVAFSIVRTIGEFVWKASKAVASTVFSFVYNVVTKIIGAAVRAIVFEVVLPIITAVIGAVVANPLFFLATAAIGGLAYWAWNSFFKENGVTPSDNAVARPSDEFVSADEALAQNRKASTVRTSPVSTSSSTSPSVVEPSTSPSSIATRINTARTSTSGSFKGFGSDIDGYIKEASSMFGLPEDVLRGFIKMEAGWTGAISPTGAIGAGQFTYRTWNSLANKPPGKAIGMIPITSATRETANDPRFNLRINTLATALLAKENADMLKHNGIPLTGENLYMMHNIGPGIMQVMLGRPVNAQTIEDMKHNGMKAGMSATDFLNYQKSRFNLQYQIANRVPDKTDTQRTSIAVGQPVTVSRPPQVAANDASSDAPNLNVLPEAIDKSTIVKGVGKTLIKVKT